MAEMSRVAFNSLSMYKIVIIPVIYLGLVDAINHAVSTRMVLFDN